MDDGLRIETLPLDTPDDDPRWAGFYDAASLGFVEERQPDEHRTQFRDFSRADGIRNRGVWDDAETLPGFPVATFGSLTKPLNVGAGRLVPANLVTDVTVRATHRRRGILRALMTQDLAEAKERGDVVALLTASEGSIYGRFGFGIATRLLKADVDCRQFALREPEIPGRLAYAHPSEAVEHWDRLVDVALHRDRGAFARMSFHRMLASGEWDWESKGPDKALRCVLHRDEAGDVDGMALYRPVKDSDPGRIKVSEILSSHPRAALSLWQLLASIDLVDIVETRQLRLDDPLPLALVNPRAVKVTGAYDMLWLRLLDTQRALAERGWDHDGDLVLRVTDEMGLADGTWRIAVRDGRAEVTAVGTDPDATITADTLAQLYLGGVSGATLAAAGRIDGDAAAVARLFDVVVAPYAPVGF